MLIEGVKGARVGDELSSLINIDFDFGDRVSSGVSSPELLSYGYEPHVLNNCCAGIRLDYIHKSLLLRS